MTYAPKVWTEKEVVDLILTEIQKCPESRNPIERTIAENIYSRLALEGLIDSERATQAPRR